jgi:DNA-binding transcriptional regulator YiaG
MDFPNAVKFVRSVTGMSQEALARALNVSFATINRWENGKTRPNQMAKSVFFDFCERNGINAQNLSSDKNLED